MKALELADKLENDPWHLIALDKKAAAELRRLAEVNAELLEALKESTDVLEWVDVIFPDKSVHDALIISKAAITKAKEQQ